MYTCIFNNNMVYMYITVQYLSQYLAYMLVFLYILNNVMQVVIPTS